MPRCGLLCSLGARRGHLPKVEADYKATRAYWEARTAAEHAGLSPAEAEKLERQAYLRAYGPTRLRAEVDGIVEAAAEGSI